jgi:ribosome-associated protein
VSDESLRVSGQVEIPADELSWRFHTTGGPGGQHANRSHTGVELVFDIAASTAFDETTKRRVIERLGHRVKAGSVAVEADDSRSQWRNRQTARRRLADLLRDAMVESKPRTPTKPSSASRRRRLERKRARGALKRLRRPPDPD